MSVEFRQRTPAEYLKILRRRKWLIILPVIAVGIAVSYAIFQAAGRVPVEHAHRRQTFDPAAVGIPMSTEEALTRQLASITQVVTSRSSLEPLVDKYELYEIERRRGEPMESIIAMVQRDIKVDVNTTRNDITNGFDISYRYRDPRIAQAMTAELAGKYISEQQKEQVSNAKAALQFIDNQVKQTKDELDAIDAKRLEFMQENLPNLPVRRHFVARSIDRFARTTKGLDHGNRSSSGSTLIGRRSVDARCKRRQRT